MSGTATSARTSTSTFSLVQTINYLTDEIWNKLKVVIRDSGLEAATFVGNQELYTRAIRAWLTSGHLENVYIEIYDKSTNKLVTRWDINVSVDSSGYTGLWADTEGIRYALRKAGRVPSSCSFDIKVHNKPGRPDVDGWSKCSQRPKDHLTKNSVGTTATPNGFNVKIDFYK